MRTTLLILLTIPQFAVSASARLADLRVKVTIDAINAYRATLPKT